MVAPGPVVRLFFLGIVADAPLPIAGEHHRVGLLYSHSATTDGDVPVSCKPTCLAAGPFFFLLLLLMFIVLYRGIALMGRREGRSTCMHVYNSNV